MTDPTEPLLAAHFAWMRGGPDGSRLIWAYLTPEERGAFRRANLTGANLSGVDLSWANLTGTNLTGVDLTGADLTGADLSGANLTGTNLTGVDLTGADLTGADLSGANLTGTKIGDHTVNRRVAQLQCSRGYGWIGFDTDNGLLICAGCRTLLIADAKKYWGRSYTGRGNRAEIANILRYITAQHKVLK
jgi:hypothetical protein